jgi:hypothetical protein
MSTTELQVIFEGHAVESGKIDARVLGTSLTAYSEVFQRANSLANGEASEAVVLVESNFQKGSFDVNLQLVQNIVENAKALITAHPFLSAGELAAAIGFLWSKRESMMSVLKWLKGEKPERVTQTGNNVELVLFGQKKTITNTVNIFLNDPLMRDAIRRTVQPLRQPGYDRIRLEPKETDTPAEPTTIEKIEAPYFEPDPMQLAVVEAPDEGERDMVLIVMLQSCRSRKGHGGRLLSAVRPSSRRSKTKSSGKTYTNASTSLLKVIDSECACAGR